MFKLTQSYFHTTIINQDGNDLTVKINRYENYPDEIDIEIGNYKGVVVTIHNIDLESAKQLGQDLMFLASGIMEPTKEEDE
tara:strand:- start:339 stop:581 length:243 start_codon:yes stop_codon:yes gene_type:complete